MTEQFTPTRTAALARLETFAPKAGRAYAARRNFDLGPGRHDDVSCLSPYLRCRLLTEAEAVETVLQHHSASAAEKFIQEVFWRTYWKGWLELRPDVWEQYKTALDHRWNAVQTQSGLRARWEAACRGETEIECFNFWAQELVKTGYLHNHARMWMASIWIFTLKLPWEMGADFFLRHLLDGDPASNTLSWRWVAGIQTPGKTYLARAGNINQFTDRRFHPKWQLASEAPALEAAAVSDPRALPVLPPPDPKLRTGFLLHEDDLSPEFALEGLAPIASAVLQPQTDIGPLLPAPQVAEFRKAAQRDAASRVADRLGAISYVRDAKAILDWAKAHDMEQIVTPYAPQGPVATELAEVGRASQAPVLRRRMRPYDQMAWPHATRGFFAFKKRIPEFIFNLCGNMAA